MREFKKNESVISFKNQAKIIGEFKKIITRLCRSSRPFKKAFKNGFGNHFSAIIILIGLKKELERASANLKGHLFPEALFWKRTANNIDEIDHFLTKLRGVS